MSNTKIIDTTKTFRELGDIYNRFGEMSRKCKAKIDMCWGPSDVTDLLMAVSTCSNMSKEYDELSKTVDCDEEYKKMGDDMKEYVTAISLVATGMVFKK